MDVDTPALEDTAGRRNAALLSRRFAMPRLRPLIQTQNRDYDAFEFDRHGDLPAICEVSIAGRVRYRTNGNAKSHAHLCDSAFYLNGTRSWVFACHTQALGMEECFDGGKIFRLSCESLLGRCARCRCEIA